MLQTLFTKLKKALPIKFDKEMQSQIVSNKQDLDMKLSESNAKVKLLTTENEMYAAQVKKLLQVYLISFYNSL